ncbi:MAG: hypothetical protein RR138_07490, partial [Akkermansia sp.]
SLSFLVAPEAALTRICSRTPTYSFRGSMRNCASFQTPNSMRDLSQATHRRLPEAVGGRSAFSGLARGAESLYL